MAITFPVCDVLRAGQPLPEVSLRSALQQLLGAPVEACGACVDVVVPTSANAFLLAARVAHAEHRPLVLTPDAVWLCLAQGFAHHVNLHAEELRGRFIRHGARDRLIVREDSFLKGSPDNPWPRVFAGFSEQIAGRIGRQRDLIVCDFSTTGPVERAASEIVLMDAMQRYFEYQLHWICGIPEVTLTGTVDDWRSVYRRSQHFAEYGLEWWTAVLLPALGQIVAAASGRPDIPFWRSFFNSSTGGGCDPTTRISGWAVRDQADATPIDPPAPQARHDPYARPTATGEYSDDDIEALLGDGDGIYRPHVPVFPDIVLQPVRCSRAATREGRLILSATMGLYFIAATSPDDWLAGALCDDDAPPDPRDTYAAMFGSPPGEQLAAIPGSFHLDPTALARFAVAHHADGLVALTVPLPTGERLYFEFRNQHPDLLAAWVTRLRYV